DSQSLDPAEYQGCSLEPGVSIRYLPSDPSVSRLDPVTDGSVMYAALASVVIGILLCLIPAALTVSCLYTFRSRLKLMREGLLVTRDGHQRQVRHHGRLNQYRFSYL